MLTEGQVRIAEDLGMDIKRLNSMPPREATEAIMSAVTAKRIAAAKEIRPGSLVFHKGQERVVSYVSFEGFLILQGVRGNVNPLRVQVLSKASGPGLPF